MNEKVAYLSFWSALKVLRFESAPTATEESTDYYENS